MLTKSQNAKYWRRWSACARANAWRMQGGRLDPAAVLDASAAHRAVNAAALQLAQTEVLGLTANHLRHACHIVALGHDKPHAKFTNKDFDALLNYWGDERAVAGLLITPDHLGSIIHEANPDLKNRERLLVQLRRDFVEAYVVTLASAIYGTKDWEQLSDDGLARLHAILRTKPNARRVRNAECGMRSPEIPHSELPTQHCADPDWSIA